MASCIFYVASTYQSNQDKLTVVLEFLFPGGKASIKSEAVLIYSMVSDSVKKRHASHLYTVAFVLYCMPLDTSIQVLVYNGMSITQA